MHAMAAPIGVVDAALLGYALATLRLCVRALTDGHTQESILSFALPAAVSESPLPVALITAACAYASARRLATSRAHPGEGPKITLREATHVCVLLGLTGTLTSAAELARRQTLARPQLAAALARAGVPLRLTSRQLSPARIAAALLPDLSIRMLSRNIEIEHGVVYGRARKGRYMPGSASAGSGRAETAGASLAQSAPAAGESSDPDEVPADTTRPWQPSQRKSPLRLSVWHHKNRKMVNAPCLLYIHGGAWVVGTPSRHSMALMYEVARNGWLVFTIEYRLAPRAPYPHMLFDCKRAVAWVRNNAFRYGGDGSFIVVAGESAGGHLALMTGLTPNVPSLQRGADLQDADTSVQGIIDLYGVTDWTDTRNQYLKRDPKGTGIRTFVEKLVLRKRYERHTHEFVKGSPLWWVHGRTLPDALSDTVVGQALGLQRASAARAAGEFAAATATAHQSPPTSEQPDDVDAPADAHSIIDREAADPISAEAGVSQISDMCMDRLVPPVFIVHGTCDSLVPLEDSLLFWEALQSRRRRDANTSMQELRNRLTSSSGNTLDGAVHDDPRRTLVADVFAVLPGAHHAFNFLPSFRTLALGDAIVDWLSHLYERARGRSAFSLQSVRAASESEDDEEDEEEGSRPAAAHARPRL